ncbi:tyrosine-type recombinase/integrase [Methanoculleus sp.]|uniref:tyrosine-type recombinase/integrase n=1 Tax=Methanoculleus sp. TaxID=90427 RepID=UPI00345BFC30|nr:site-specific integrase [Methanoculleus sp.]
MRLIAEGLNKDFDKVEKEDLVKYLAKLEKTNLAENTKKDYKVAIKRFYKWVNGDAEYPKLVTWIKANVKRARQKMPEDLLTEEDIKRIVSCATNSRDKAILFTLYESGARIGEIANLKVKDVIFDDISTQIIVDGKTGMRKIRLVSSEMYIKNYLNDSKHSDKPESPLWLKSDKNAMTYPAIMKVVRTTVENADIKKKVTPHLFRHSRATFLARHLTEAQLCQHLGWAQGSDMPRTYVHMSGRDTDDAILGLYGKKKVEENKEKSILVPLTCPRCKSTNEPTATFCSKCGSPLTLNIAIELEERRKEGDAIMDFLLKDEDIKKLIAQKINKQKM